jgi:hypothetical protein
MPMLPLLGGGLFVHDRLLVVVPASLDFNLFTFLGSPTTPNMRLFVLLHTGLVAQSTSPTVGAYSDEGAWAGTPDIVIENRGRFTGLGGTGGLGGLFSMPLNNEWYGGGGGGGAGGGTGGLGRTGTCDMGFPGMTGSATAGGLGGNEKDNVVCPGSAGFSDLPTDGSTGGPALSIFQKTKLINLNGVIAGGGGGGGGGGFDDFGSPAAYDGGVGGGPALVGFPGDGPGVAEPLAAPGLGGEPGNGIEVHGTIAELLTIVSGGDAPQLLGGVVEV